MVASQALFRGLDIGSKPTPSGTLPLMEEARKLNPKQLAFISEYLIDFNGTQAAIRAGYSARTAQEQASVLLSKPMVQRALEEAKAAHKKVREVSVDRIIQELERIAYGDLKNSVRWNEGGTQIQPSDDLPADVSATIMSIEEDEHETTSPLGHTHVRRKVKVKHYDKLRALELLGRYKSLFVDRKEVTGKGGGAIEVQTKSWMDVVNEETATLTLTK